MSEKKWDIFPKPSPEELKIIITNPQGAEILVKRAEDIGQALARQLTTSQIRAIFGEVRRIEIDWKINSQRASRNLVLLKPKMSYRARKERGKAVGELASVLLPAVDLVGNDGDNFTRFVEFFEAILAYHRAYGGN